MRRIVSCFSLFLTLALTVGTSTGAQSTEAINGPDTISYASYGNGRTTLVLVHGWSNNRTFWEPHVYSLAQRYRVVALDLASFGESTAHRAEWTMASFADDIAAVLDDVGAEQAVLVGFSMGGGAVLELASRGRSDVAGVVLVDVFNNVESARSDEDIANALASQRERWHDPVHLRAAVSPQASETLVRRYVSRTPATVPDQWWDSFRNLFLWERDELRQKLTDVTVPIRAINSDRIPTTVEAWQRYAPGFDVHILRGVNHLGSIWERTDEFDEALISFMGDFRR